jgi:N-acetylneuraminic acid mutarotase
MRTRSGLAYVFLLALGTAAAAVGQAAAVTHNTWSSGTPIPTPLAYTMTAALEGKIYVAGGYAGPCCNGTVVADVQIYDPATNTWSTGVPLPTARWSGAAAAADGKLYVIGGTTPTGLEQVTTVWAFDPRTSTWSVKASLPAPLSSPGIAVRDGIIYVVGGYDGGARLNTLESYDPKTDSWTELAPLLVGKSEASAARIVDTIVAADGYTDDGQTGDNEAYDFSTNTWTALTPDPTGRNVACSGNLNGKLIVAGGYQGSGPGAPAINSTESFDLTTNTWKTLAPMPQAAMTAGSAVYQGRLYCISGWAAAYGTLVDNVQIYQP